MDASSQLKHAYTGDRYLKSFAFFFLFHFVCTAKRAVLTDIAMIAVRR